MQGAKLRERKERKLYSDDWALGDEEIEGHYAFNLEEKLTSSKFNVNFVKDLTNTEFNLQYVQRNGFQWPLLFKNKNGLDIVVPDEKFSINDIRLCVGSRRMLDVMDVNTQKNVEMTMKDWQRYYESADKDKLLNVISLEFSHTKLETLVEPPKLVKEIDWVQSVWPRHLKEAQTESTNVLEDMMYPKVQKYCLMSVKNCYTDFHIDFGGTSVWYHIIKGKKIFWLIPPSEKNLNLYTQWVLSGKQSDVFFGDTVEKCARVELEAGYTFFIPTGWIHAVYTPQDSLVFGGNFLHSYGIEKQLKVAMVEDATHVPQKFRYPFFTEMLWYLLERYVHILIGRTHLTLPPEEQEKYEKYLSYKAENNNFNSEEKHLTQYELHGLKAIVMFLHGLPTSKKCVPDLIKDPIALVRDVRTVVEQHRYDSPEKAATNRPILEWWKREASKFPVKRSIGEVTGFSKKRKQSFEGKIQLPPNAAKSRHRRVRCKSCESCLREDCQQCIYCLDMTKYGGSGTMKQTCKLKKCVQPCLPVTALCYVCQLDGWLRMATVPPQKPVSDTPSTLMECSICYKISHPECMADEVKNIDGIIAPDQASTWDCPQCIDLGYNKSYKGSKQTNGKVLSSVSETNLKSPNANSETEEVTMKIEEVKDNESPLDDVKHEKSDDISTKQKIPRWEELQRRTSQSLVRPKWIVRPAPIDDNSQEGSEEYGDKDFLKNNLALCREVIIPVFKWLTRKELVGVMTVCKKWSKFSIDPKIWTTLSLAEKTLEGEHIMGIVRRQPLNLILDWAKLSDEQLEWLLARLPGLQSLSLVGLSWQEIHSLTSPYCPSLSKLKLSFCEGIDDNNLKMLLSPPRVHRPGHRDAATRLRNLTHFTLAGTRISDDGIHAIASNMPFLTYLDISDCKYITEVAAAVIALPSSLICYSLTYLDIRRCDLMSPLCLPSLKELPLISKLFIHPTVQIPFKAIEVWAQNSGYEINYEEQYLFKEIKDESSSKSEKQSKVPNKFNTKLSPEKKRKKSSKSSKKLKAVYNNIENKNKKSVCVTPNTRRMSKSKIDIKNTIKKVMDIEESSSSDYDDKEVEKRRSERSNKGSKYSPALINKSRIPKVNVKKPKVKCVEGLDILKSKKSIVKRKTAKDIVTRSKKVENTISPQTEEEISDDKLDSPKDKSKQKQAPRLSRKDDVKISSMKKKIKDSSSSSDSSVDNKSKKVFKKTESKTPKDLKKISKSTPKIDPKKQLDKRRRERTDSSPAIASTSSKALKLESSKLKTDSVRDRPERLHRSPRRLSLS